MIRNLAEEVTSADPVLPDVRRKEVQASLMVCLEQIIPFLQRGLREAVTRFAAAKTPQNLNTCKAVLEAVHALLDWMPAKYVFESGLVNDICSFLVHPDLFEHLCDCLASISGRKASTIDAAYSPQMVAVWDSVLNWCQSVQSAAAFPKQIDFLTRLTVILSHLVRMHMELLVPAAYDALKQKALSVLGSLLAHPFQKVSFVALELWVHIFRHHVGDLLAPAFRTSLLTELLKLACFRLMKIDAELFEDQEFESQEEYNQFFSNFRGTLLHLLALMSEIDAPLCFTVARMRYEQLLALPKPTDHLNADGWVSMRTTRFQELEAVGTLTDGLFRAVPNDRFKSDGNLFATAEGLLRAILNWQCEDPLLQTRRAHALSMFAPVLSASGTLFQATIEALMAGVSFRPAMYTQAYPLLPEDLKACRRRAIVSLVALARKKDLVDAYFLPLFPQLVQTILGLLQAGRIAQVEKITLFEFLVLVSQSLKSTAEQQAFLKTILEEPLTQWTGAQLNQLLEYTESEQAPAFMQLIGLTPEDQQALQTPTLPASHRTPTRELRSQVRYILHTFMSVFKPLFVGTGTAIDASSGTATVTEAAHAAATNLLPAVLPNVVRLLGHIYSIRSPRARAHLPQAMLGLLSPTADQLLNPESNNSMAATSTPPPKNYNLVWDVRRWMDRVTDSALTILMLAAKSGVAYYESIAQPQMHHLYITCLYTNLQHMHLREVRTFVDKYLESVFNLCPPRLYLDVFIGRTETGATSNTLPSIFGVLHQRLQSGWDRMRSAKQTGAPRNNSSGGSASLSDEIHEESELCELSRCISENATRTIELQYLSLHAKHMAQVAAETAAAPAASAQADSREAEREKERREKERRQQEATLLMQAPFCQFLFTQSGVLSSLFGMLTFLVGCPDSASSVRAIRLLHRILPVGIGSRTPLAVQLYAQVFQACLGVLATANQQLLDTVEAEMTAMLKDIYVALVLPGLSIAPRQSLLALPSVEAQSVTALETLLATICSEKKYRAGMRSFLDRAIKQPRLRTQRAILDGQDGKRAATFTNPLELLQANSNAHTSGRVGQVENIKEPVGASHGMWRREEEHTHACLHVHDDEPRSLLFLPISFSFQCCPHELHRRRPATSLESARSSDRTNSGLASRPLMRICSPLPSIVRVRPSAIPTRHAHRTDQL